MKDKKMKFCKEPSSSEKKKSSILNKKKTKVSTPQSTKMLYIIFFIMNLITIYFVSFSMEGKSLKCHFPLIVPSSILTSPGLERTIVLRVVSSVK